MTMVLPEQRLDVSKLADVLGHERAFAASGIEVPRGRAQAPRRRSRNR